MTWQPSSGPETARRRAALLERIRRYFAVHDVLAVDTPSLVHFAASDPTIESLFVRTRGDARWFLHTSPESSMKRLLAAGYPDIYTICHVFRDAEVGRLHAPEFTMAEWYRRGFDLPAIITDTVELIATALDRTALTSRVAEFDYYDALAEFAGIDASHCSTDDLADAAGADADLRAALGQRRDAWLDLILAAVVAPQFREDRLTVIQHYPASQAALARRCPGNRQLADRFEVFFGAIELANGYVELADAKEQRRRFAADLRERETAGQTVHAPDAALLAALDAGLPACAGVALGVDRLHMVADSAAELAAVSTFSFAR